MMKLLFAIFFVCSLAFLLACDPATPLPVNNQARNSSTQSPGVDSHGHSEDSAPRISLADAKADFDNKTAIFVDTHPKDYFDREHIAGAINVPATEFPTASDKIPKGKKIVAYCS